MDRCTQAWQCVEKWADKTPDKEALVYEDQRISWMEFKERMDMTAHGLMAAGVKSGECIAMLAMARNEFMESYMAAGKIGAMWLGLNPKFTLDELRYQLLDSRPKVLIAVRSFMENDLKEMLLTLMEELPFIEKLFILGDAFPGAENYTSYFNQFSGITHPDLEKRAEQSLKTSGSPLLMYTSGSTGKPKGVVQSHSSIVSNVAVMLEQLNFQLGERMLVHFPINHVASDVEIGLSCIFGGGTLIFMDKFDPVSSMEMILAEKITILGQVPVMFLMQMQTPHWQKEDWYQSIRAFIVSGASPSPVLVEALRAIQNRTGCAVYNAYGSTEACGLVTYTQKDDSIDFIAKSIGRVPEPMKWRLTDEAGHDVPLGTVGEMLLQGPFLFNKYLNKPKLTEKAFENGWYHSGDLAFSDDQGNLFIVGRKSDMYKTGGENVFPREIEAVLENHPAVLFSAVLAAPDPV